VAVTKPRRRRTPAEAEAEILDAADRLLRERPFHALTIDQLMAATTLSRKSFYVYFADRYELLTRLVAPLRERLDAANRPLLEGDDLVADGLATLRAVAGVLAADGALVRALHEASIYDRRAAELWRAFNRPVVAAVSARIRREVEAETIPPLDVEALVPPLIGMNLFTLFERVVGAGPAEREAVARGLHAVWTRTLTLGDPPTA
jgi:AcrR family transcriptional regulator